MDKRRLLPLAMIAGFMMVTVGHVANYAGGFEHQGWQWLGFAYALTVDAAIAISAYFMQWRTTRLAPLLYATFTVASGLMNIVYVKPWMQPGWDAVGAWVYALFPTAAIAGAGHLYRQADHLSTQREKRSRASGERARAELREARAELESARAELRDTRAELESARAKLREPRALREPTRADFVAICADLNGRLARMSALDANHALVRAGFLPVPDSTARGWLRFARDQQEKNNEKIARIPGRSH